MIPNSSKSIPLPAAVLALSVAVCLGAAGPVDAAALGRASSQAEQRQTLEHLLEAIQQAAKKLTDQLDSQAALHERQPIDSLAVITLKPITSPDDLLAISFLREALLNLPPPSC